MKYLIYECSYKNGKFYYMGETEVDKGGVTSLVMF